MSQHTNVPATAANQGPGVPADSTGNNPSTSHHNGRGNSTSSLIGAVSNVAQPNQPGNQPPFPGSVLKTREMPGLLTGHTQ